MAIHLSSAGPCQGWAARGVAASTAGEARFTAAYIDAVDPAGAVPDDILRGEPGSHHAGVVHDLLVAVRAASLDDILPAGKTMSDLFRELELPREWHATLFEHATAAKSVINAFLFAGAAATAGVIKDAGDDPDVTHGATIVAEKSLNASGSGTDSDVANGIIKAAQASSALTESDAVVQLTVTSPRATTILCRVTEEYYLLLWLARDGNFGRGRFELRKTAAALEKELL